MKHRGVSLAKQAGGREGSEGGRVQMVSSSAAEGAKEERVGCAKKIRNLSNLLDTGRTSMVGEPEKQAKKKNG